LRPALDTDLMDFLGASQPDHRVREAIEEAYEQGKKKLRELTAMPYGWFKELHMRGKTWDSLRKTLNRYGFKLYKKGHVVQ
jgi:hypothetical protein